VVRVVEAEGQVLVDGRGRQAPGPRDDDVDVDALEVHVVQAPLGVVVLYAGARRAGAPGYRLVVERSLAARTDPVLIAGRRPEGTAIRDRVDPQGRSRRRTRIGRGVRERRELVPSF
jgi:hypothetical protein